MENLSQWDVSKNQYEFDNAYKKVILENDFFEQKSYYVQQKPRYLKTLQLISKIPLSFSNSTKILEIGGGQMGLLITELFGLNCTVADVNDKYKSSLLNYGIEFQMCDLMHEHIDKENYYDLVIMCEVIEHFPIPPYIVLEKIRKCLKPGGFIFLTTPNLYRLRNLIRLAMGLRVFDTFLIPDKGSSIGHPLEYSKSHLYWQLNRANFQSIKIEIQQLDNSGSTLTTQIARFFATPLLTIRPLWRDKLIATAMKEF